MVVNLVLSAIQKRNLSKEAHAQLEFAEASIRYREANCSSLKGGPNGQDSMVASAIFPDGLELDIVKGPNFTTAQFKRPEGTPGLTLWKHVGEELRGPIAEQLLRKILARSRQQLNATNW